MLDGRARPGRMPARRTCCCSVHVTRVYHEIRHDSRAFLVRSFSSFETGTRGILPVRACECARPCHVCLCARCRSDGPDATLDRASSVELEDRSIRRGRSGIERRAQMLESRAARD